MLTEGHLFFSIFRKAYRAALPLTLGASALAGALVTSAIMGRHEVKMDAITLATVQNETVVYRQAPPPKPNVLQDDSERPSTERMEASDQQDNDVQLNFPRTVQIVRFLAPEAAGSGKLTATTRESMREGLESDSILMPINSGSCQTPRKYANTGEQQPRLGTRDGFLEIFREASAAVEPCKRSFNDPTSWLDLERTGIFGSGDDLNGPAAELGECGGQLFPAVGAISENVTQLRKQQSNVLEQRHCSVAVLDIGGVYLPGKH